MYLPAASALTSASGFTAAGVASAIRAGHDFWSVADATAQAQAVTDWPTLSGAAISAGNPVKVYRQDDDSLRVSKDGTAWATFPSVADSGWESVTMASGWINNSSLSARRIGSQVYLKGMIRDDDGSIAEGSYNVCTLAADYRPSYEMRIPAVRWVNGGTDSFARLIIGTSGTITILVTGGAATGVTASGVTFLVD